MDLLGLVWHIYSIQFKALFQTQCSYTLLVHSGTYNKKLITKKDNHSNNDGTWDDGVGKVGGESDRNLTGMWINRGSLYIFLCSVLIYIYTLVSGP